MSKGARGGGELGAAFVFLIVVGVIAKFFWWILAVLGVVIVAGLLVWAVDDAVKRADARARVRAAIAARADEQHAQVMVGDDRGFYGAYPPAVPPAAERLPRVGENWADYLAEQRRKSPTS